MLWDDAGPISQGKILTAILQDEKAKARAALHGWTTADLAVLAHAVGVLEVMIRMERQRRAV